MADYEIGRHVFPRMTPVDAMTRASTAKLYKKSDPFELVTKSLVLLGESLDRTPAIKMDEWFGYATRVRNRRIGRTSIAYGTALICEPKDDSESFAIRNHLHVGKESKRLFKLIPDEVLGILTSASENPIEDVARWVVAQDICEAVGVSESPLPDISKEQLPKTSFPPILLVKTLA